MSAAATRTAPDTSAKRRVGWSRAASACEAAAVRAFRIMQCKGLVVKDRLRRSGQCRPATFTILYSQHMDEGALPGHVRAMDRPRVPGGMDRRRLKGEIGGRH